MDAAATASSGLRAVEHTRSQGRYRVDGAGGDESLEPTTADAVDAAQYLAPPRTHKNARDT